MPPQNYISAPRSGPAALSPFIRVLPLRCVALLAASPVFWPAHVQAIIMDTDTPESAYRAKGQECLGFPGRPVNFRVYDPTQSATPASYCSGVLLNRNWVLTAGHCVYPRLANGVFLIGMGTNTYYETGHRVRVKRVAVHPLYDDYLYAPNRVDLALLELESPIEGYADAILGVQTPADDSQVIAAGFGRAGRPLATPPPAGMTGFLRGWVAPKFTSTDPYGRIYVFRTRFVVGNYLNANGCPGDSGSPGLVWDAILNNYRLAGIASWVNDENCVQQFSHTAFVNLADPVSKNWITETISSASTNPQPQLTLSSIGGEVELRLIGQNIDPASWRVEESSNLQQWEGEFPFTSNVCRRPITGTKCHWRAYQLPVNPILPFSNLGTTGAAGNATGKDITAGVPGAIASGTQNRAIRSTLPKIGGSLIAPYQTAFNPSGPFSVEIWAKPGQTRDLGQMILSYAPDPVSGDLGGWRLSQGRPSPQDGNGFDFAVFTTQSDNSTIRATAAVTVQPGNLYHIVGVYDGTQLEVYVNGVRMSQIPMPSGHAVRPNPWAGVVVGGHNYWYLGDLDEPAIYPRALTPAEVLEHYQAGTAANPPVSYRDVVLGDSPVGYWPFDEPAPAGAPPPAPQAVAFSFNAASSPAAPVSPCCGGDLPEP